MEAVRQYFSAHYPDRSDLRALAFRGGEGDRLAAVRAWLPRLDGIDILDAGCGDGTFLADQLGASGAQPRRIRLEDVASRMVDSARRNLEGRARIIEAAAVDIRDSP